MSEYIEKKAVTDEIEKRLRCNGSFDEVGDHAWFYDEGLVDAYMYIRSFVNALPAQGEWNEEDEKMLDLTVENLTELKDRYGAGYGRVGDCIAWLEARRPQPSCKTSGDKPESGLEAEIERWWNERYAKVDKNYKFDSTRGHYLDNETIIDLARNFAEWGAARLLAGAIKTNIFDIEDGSDAAKIIVRIPGAKTGDKVYVVKEEVAK